MKKNLFLLVVVFTFSSVYSQGIIFGVKAGVNFADLKFSVSEMDDYADMRTAFHVGGIADVSISDKFSIQTELLYSSVGAKWSDDDYENDLITDYLTIPFLAKYYVAEGFSLQVGPQVGFLISAKVKGDDEDDDIKDDLESIDFGLGFGAAYKLESGLFFDARYVLGLSNTWTTDIIGDETAKNNVIQVSIGYMFQ